MPATAASKGGDEAVQQTLNARSLLWNHALSFIKSICLKCAVELHFPDAILSHGMAATVSELSAALSIPPSKTSRLRVLLRLLSL
ncbi:8-hydroxyquercetin 8-O-methyltransferase [Apostasia shenzhenica]|uniref:8-hydroxyquercetin 8-O-methyltransferase n=1 Tax=Apostasia shenzhenica TaxID=1088818 RepID=A0A2H9ZSM1_9ASPA|nr:8-hydroxyquercetin 8-O-methyltransferase [Apostasia shenzhenica]